MRKSIIFSQSQVVDFCQATRDFNMIHNPKYMHERGKQVIVPGMYLFATVMKEIEHLFFEEKLDSFRIFFNTLISCGEEVILGAERIAPERPDHYLFAFNGKDSFSLKQERSRIYRNPDHIVFPAEGHIHELPVDNLQLTTFSGLLGCRDKWLCQFLFALAYTSNALTLANSKPQDPVEREIRLLLDKLENPDQVAPFYQTLDIYLNADCPVDDGISYLGYRILFERVIPGKVYTAHITCTRDRERIFLARYKLIAIPDRLIMRLAKDL